VQKKAVGVYETILLRNAEDILRTANQQFENGEVNYLEWVLLTNQAIAVRSAHLDALTTLLNIQIQLQLLTGQFK
jgi:cobalt-zinc-cadmium resistance protein CzcA